MLAAGRAIQECGARAIYEYTTSVFSHIVELSLCSGRNDVTRCDVQSDMSSAFLPKTYTTGNLDVLVKDEYKLQRAWSSCVLAHTCVSVMNHRVCIYMLCGDFIYAAAVKGKTSVTA